MSLIKVCSSQYSNFFGDNQIHFPYSIATLIAYCLTDSEVKTRYGFEKVFLFRSGIESDIEHARDADILLCSCYCWNWEITNHLAREVKKLNPNCLVVFGGPEVPRASGGFFDAHPYVDILVHGEGEIVLRDLLKAFLVSRSLDLRTLNVRGTETRYKRCPPQERISDLDIIPSPYSTDLIWDLVEKRGDIKYIVSWETNRGCPFSCTYCDWGSATMSKLRTFSEAKLFAEIEWFGANQIDYLDCCDGNFGIYQDRDLRIAQKLAESKAKTSCPERLNLTWVKTSSEKVIPIAKVLADAGMLRAVSLSVQSLDLKTLDAIKRKNIKFDKFETLIKEFADEGIQTYTELIMGLPEETLSSFKNNWEILANLNPQPAIMVWNCSVFVNAPMNDPEYIKRYGIEVFTSPMLLNHSQKDGKAIKEYEKMVRATSSLPDGQIVDVYTYNVTMMVNHVFGILEYLARYYHRAFGVSYTRFYEALIEYQNLFPETLFGGKYALAKRHAISGYSGNGWDYYDDELGNISWPIEEAIWLKLVRNKNVLQQQIEKFIDFANNLFWVDVDPLLLYDLISFQMFMVNFPEERRAKNVQQHFLYDWLGYFNETSPIHKGAYTLSKLVKVQEPDIIRWGYETIWFGRRANRYKMKLKEIQMV